MRRGHRLGNSGERACAAPEPRSRDGGRMRAALREPELPPRGAARDAESPAGTDQAVRWGLALVLAVGLALRAWSVSLSPRRAAHRRAGRPLPPGGSPRFFNWPSLYMYVMAGSTGSSSAPRPAGSRGRSPGIPRSSISSAASSRPCSAPPRSRASQPLRRQGLPLRSGGLAPAPGQPAGVPHRRLRRDDVAPRRQESDPAEPGARVRAGRSGSHLRPAPVKVLDRTLQIMRDRPVQVSA